ncbi:interleukin-10 receptor subunit beta [Tiliqua scincoides]|uniref:interleukin-10 receptor subunit beta n=1 Tax=Tiliqua scincoides TaxID=71010 RepID=UPI0034623E55
MGARGWQYLLCSCLFCSVHGLIPEPQNVRIHSVNFNSTLLWDPPYFHEENVTYTVQYLTYSTSFNDLCTKTNFTECDISDVPIYSNHMLRVRTESEKGQSKWIDLAFNPLIDTIISPPVVQVETTRGGLYVEVSGPSRTRNGSIWSIGDFYGSLIYSMLIWKKEHEEQVRNVTMSENSKIMTDLDPGTIYCFQIQVLISELNKRGEWTEVSCIRTDDIGKNPVWLAIIIVLVLVLFPLFCVMILPVYRRVKYTYFPSYTLPEHFKEFLGKPSYGSEFVASQPHGDDRVCEKITVVSEEQKHIDSAEQPNSAKHQFQRFQGDTPELKEVEDCTPLLTIQIGGNNPLHPQGTCKASIDTLHITDLKIATL